MVIIYKTTNLVNGKIYVGQYGGSAVKRPYYLGSGKILKQALTRYGREAFKKEIIEFCTTDAKANEREKFWIANLNSRNRQVGYNILYGGVDGARGVRIPEDVKKKISRALKGRVFTEEHRLRIGEGNRGKTRSLAYSVWLSEMQKGRKLSEEHKLKISRACRGRRLSIQDRKNKSTAALRSWAKRKAVV